MLTKNELHASQYQNFSTSKFHLFVITLPCEIRKQGLLFISII